MIVDNAEHNIVEWRRSQGGIELSCPDGYVGALVGRGRVAGLAYVRLENQCAPQRGEGEDRWTGRTRASRRDGVGCGGRWKETSGSSAVFRSPSLPSDPGG